MEKHLAALSAAPAPGEALPAGVAELNDPSTLALLLATARACLANEAAASAAAAAPLRARADAAERAAREAEAAAGAAVLREAADAAAAAGVEVAQEEAMLVRFFPARVRKGAVSQC
jgi:hypothetical protein